MAMASMNKKANESLLSGPCPPTPWSSTITVPSIDEDGSIGPSTLVYTFRQCLPRCKILCGILFARESVPAFQAIYRRLSFGFDFYMASTRRGHLRNGPSLFPNPFLPTFHVCIAFSGYRLILSVLSLVFNIVGTRSRITHHCVYCAISGPLVVTHRFHFPFHISNTKFPIRVGRLRPISLPQFPFSSFT